MSCHSPSSALPFYPFYHHAIRHVVAGLPLCVLCQCLSVVKGKNLEQNNFKFWDAVIISSSDDNQRESYVKQIDMKSRRGELPEPVPFYVFADPPGYKIGCGGSTLYVLYEMEKIYGTKLAEMRILLIPSGGYSQRLPNLSILGKLFSPLPFQGGNFQMLDLILATYLPFLERMVPGVFIASSDAIISYSLKQDDEWTFENGGFTALAHPSPIKVGTSHGVYVLPERTNAITGSSFMSECLQVLQKPTADVMFERGAITKTNSCSGETIFSDSAFFFDYPIVWKFIKFFKGNCPIKCELSSYGDFLQPLGTLANPSYIVSETTSEDLAALKSALYQELFGTKLSVLVLQNSRFHHLGTMQEYIDSLCGKNEFAEFFPLIKFTRSFFTIPKITPAYIDGTVLHSVINPLSVIPESSVVEYCDTKCVIEVGENCIVSNVQYGSTSVEKLPYKIPDNTLIHTIALKDGFVTIAFSIKDDIKLSYTRENYGDVIFLGKFVKQFVKSERNIFNVSGAKVSLWEAKIFPICETAKESFRRTLDMVFNINNCDKIFLNFKADKFIKRFVCMRDILSMKDSSKMLDYQESLLCANT